METGNGNGNGIKEFFEENPASHSTIKDFLLKYLSYWPLFIILMALCVGAGYLYVRYATPKYKITALVLVKDDQTNKSNSPDDLIRNALNGEEKINIENELQLMRSSNKIERVVLKNGFNIFYYKMATVRKIDLYHDAPFALIPQTIEDSNKQVDMRLSQLNNEGVTIQIGKGGGKGSLIKWNTKFKLEGDEFVLIPKTGTFDSESNYLATWKPVKMAAGEIAEKFNVDALDKKTSIIQLNLLLENQKRGEDILNALCDEFHQSDIDDKNDVSEKTIHFIDERLNYVYSELSGVEGNLESFQGANQLVNVASQSSQSFENSNDITKSLNEISIQKNVVEMIQTYFNNPTNQSKLVPSSLGITDPTLNTLIAKFNELQLKRERETPLLANNSIELKDLNNQINDVKGSIIENLQIITKNLKLQESNLLKRNSQYKEFLTALPHKERVMQEIKRKQTVTEGLYLYLLQKREEFAISASSSNVSIYKTIDRAKGFGPVEPNKTNIYILSVFLGLLLPMGYITLRDILNEKITTKGDITGRTRLPIIGELGHIPRNIDKKVSLTERDGIGEQFRIVRANLFYLQKNKKNQTYLITSSTMGEGKSFISSNLASVIAFPGKKVALLEFDTRKPQIAKNFSLLNTMGLTNYLTGQTNDLSQLYQSIENNQTLHVYTSGPLPSNPADLLQSDRMHSLFEYLKTRYDYVIVDSPPLGLVSDALILNEFSDAVIYVVRQRYTLKKQIDFLNEVVKAKKLKNVGLLINDIKTGGKYGTGYGHGLDYNYSYGEVKKRRFLKRKDKVAD
jgi:capsular exopolysaccharide synthesis family protein